MIRFALYLFLMVLPCFGSTSVQAQVKVGAERLDLVLQEISGKRTGLVVNHTSRVFQVHLVDTLVQRGALIKAVFAPEHGFTGQVERGKEITDDKDPRLGIPIYSIYGENKKPSSHQLSQIDIMIFDMQDVGVRFFTYISTLHYVMEACAENQIPLIVLDRPNPLDHYVDGPVLRQEYQSFIGMHPVPIVHGMTIGEYALMINGEGWLKDKVSCELKVIEIQGYKHGIHYQLTVNPSPNLPDMKSIYMYPSVCLFEGTEVSEGRGTYKPFQQFGTPGFEPKNHAFIPESIPGLSQSPKYEGQKVYGYNFSSYSLEELQQMDSINLDFLAEFYRQSPDKSQFFSNSRHFDLLAGSSQLREQIINGISSKAIRASWQPQVREFQKTRSKYLIYQ